MNERNKEDYGAFTEYGAGVTKVDSGDDFQLAVKYMFWFLHFPENIYPEYISGFFIFADQVGQMECRK